MCKSCMGLVSSPPRPSAPSSQAWLVRFGLRSRRLPLRNEVCVAIPESTFSDSMGGAFAIWRSHGHTPPDFVRQARTQAHTSELLMTRTRWQVSGSRLCVCVGISRLTPIAESALGMPLASRIRAPFVMCCLWVLAKGWPFQAQMRPALMLACPGPIDRPVRLRTGAQLVTIPTGVHV